MSLVCPLCSSKKTELVESIHVADLNALYAKTLGISDAVKIGQLEYRECQDCELGFFWPLAAGDEDLYEQLQAFDGYYMDNKEEYKTALRFLPSKGTVLEVGSGKAAFATQVGADRYTGLEFNDSAIEKAKEGGVTLLKQSVEVHAAIGRQYDAVVSFQVLEHVSSSLDFVKGCVDCLKAKGILIFAVPSRDGFTGQAINNILDMPPHHVSRWSEKTLHKLAEIFGLEVIFVEHEPIASYHQQWARKIQIEARLRKILGMNFKLLDCSLAARLLSKISVLLARFSRRSQTAKGHTVIAGYQKR